MNRRTQARRWISRSWSFAIALALLTPGLSLGADIVNLSGATGPVTVNLADSTIPTNTTITGYGGTVTVTGIDVANLDANGNTVTVNGTAGPDDIAYTPTGAAAATVTSAGLSMTFNFTNVAGTFTIDPLVGIDTVTVNGDAASNQIALTGVLGAPTIQVDALQTVTLSAANTETLVVAAGLGNDSLTVNGAAQPVLIPVTYDGGGGTDSLALTGGTASSDIYTPGPNPGSGSSVIVFTSGSGGTQTVNFQNLEPVLDNVSAGTATINATNGDNAIDYSQGPGGGFFTGNTGLVSVDNFETIEFNNKTNLVINALAGSDEINLNNPTTPAGLAGITVNGADPTAGGDTLIVNGVSGGLDNVRYLPTSVGAGTVINDNQPQQPQVLFTGIEHLTLALQQSDGDGVRLDGTTGNDAIEFFHGLTGDSGSFVGAMDRNNATGGGPFTMTPMDYTGVSAQANDGDVNFFNPGGSDSFLLNGTTNDDLIAVASGEAGGTEFRNTINGIVFSRIEVFNIASGLVRAFEGDDTINVAMPAGPGVVALQVEGGSGDDLLNFTGSGANSIIANLGAAMVQEAGSAAVFYTGVEVLNVNAANNLFSLNTTTGDDELAVTPTGANAVVAQLTASAPGIGATPIVNGSNIGAFFVDLLAGSDRLTVNGTQSNDFIAVIGAPVAVAVGTLVMVNYSNAEALAVNGQAGSDAFIVTPSATTAIFIDGGDPVGVLPGDLLDVAFNPGDFVQFNRGPTSDSGGFVVNASQPVSFEHIESALSTADLSLTKTVDNSAPLLGDQIVYTITVTNHGPGNTTGVAVTDLLPAGVSHVSDDGGGAFVPGAGFWMIGALNNGATATLNITVNVDDMGAIANTAEVTASSLPDPDSTPANNVPSEDDQASADIFGASASDPNDTDGDGIPNDLDPDDDGDGVPDLRDPDRDGDGVNNDLDPAPDDPSDAGPNGMPGVPGLSVRKITVKLDFDDPGRDKIAAKGVFPLPPGFVTTGAAVDVDVGGQTQTFTLDENGLGVSGEDKFRLRIGRRSLPDGTFIGKWTLLLRRGDFVVNDVNALPLDGSAPGIEDRVLRMTLNIVGGAPTLRYSVGTVVYRSTSIKGRAKSKRP